MLFLTSLYCSHINISLINLKKIKMYVVKLFKYGAYGSVVKCVRASNQQVADQSPALVFLC